MAPGPTQIGGWGWATVLKLLLGAIFIYLYHLCDDTNEAALFQGFFCTFLMFY